jgi:hypothetical protein
MKANFLLVTGFALLSAGWVQASVFIPNPGHFTVDLNDITGTDGGGWGAGTLFTDSVNTGDSTDGFLQNICVANENQQCSSDPRMVTNGGGASIPFPSSFNADANGGGFFDFENDGPAPTTDILFVTNFVQNQTYNCASDIFRFCGFDVVQGGNGRELEILFTSGTIPVATPEPSEYVFLLATCAACAVVHRWRSRRA